jgi:hypothetical protein
MQQPPSVQAFKRIPKSTCYGPGTIWTVVSTSFTSMVKFNHVVHVIFSNEQQVILIISQT